MTSGPSRAALDLAEPLVRHLPPELAAEGGWTPRQVSYMTKVIAVSVDAVAASHGVVPAQLSLLALHQGMMGTWRAKQAVMHADIVRAIEIAGSLVQMHLSAFTKASPEISHEADLTLHRYLAVLADHGVPAPAQSGVRETPLGPLWAISAVMGGGWPVVILGPLHRSHLADGDGEINAVDYLGVAFRDLGAQTVAVGADGPHLPVEITPGWETALDGSHLRIRMRGKDVYDGEIYVPPDWHTVVLAASQAGEGLPIVAVPVEWDSDGEPGVVDAIRTGRAVATRGTLSMSSRQ